MQTLRRTLETPRRQSNRTWSGPLSPLMFQGRVETCVSAVRNFWVVVAHAHFIFNQLINSMSWLCYREAARELMDRQ